MAKITRAYSLDHEAIDQLDKLSEKRRLSRSAILRILIEREYDNLFPREKSTNGKHLNQPTD